MDTKPSIEKSQQDLKPATGAARKKVLNTSALWQLGIKSLKELETERGILASSKTEIFGCIFGRDSLITAMFLIRLYRKTGDVYFLDLVRKILVNLTDLQGRVINIESGEEPGKCIHEYRPDGHEHLTGAGDHPWYLYPDNIMRNYDTVDATPLFLMTAYSYFETSGDTKLIENILPSIRMSINWLFAYGDSNGDGFVDYRFHPDRRYGGLKVQSWMDSADSVFFENSDETPTYPIAPVEVQAYTYAALISWSKYFLLSDANFSESLRLKAVALKKAFNEQFVIKGRHQKVSLAAALDGKGRRLTSARSSMARPLYAVVKNGETAPDGILDTVFVEPLIDRLLAKDLYIPGAGIRTLSSRSSKFDPFSYHNGSIWPHDTAIFAEALENFGHRQKAAAVRGSLIKAYSFFNTPIELFAFSKGKYLEYGDSQHRACRVQAWSVASLLSSIDNPDDVPLNGTDSRTG